MSRQYQLLLAAGFVAMSAFLTNCGSARRSEPINGAARIADPQTNRGRLVFMNRCNRCHPGGEAGLGPAINDKPLPEFLIKTQIRAGLGVMPSFPRSELSDADLDAVIAYLKAIRSADAKPM
jgi:mono/diheme cytochrome c family protein